MADVLAGAGFAVERLTFSAPGTPDVDNLFATIGSGAPHLVFAGHTDVVPPGDEARWSHPPFAGEIAERRALRPRRGGHEGRHRLLHGGGARPPRRRGQAGRARCRC